MDIITKYEGILREVNAEIEQFNLLLAKFRFELLDASSPGSRLIVANKPWKKLNLGMCPSGDYAGLYVLCAYQKDNPACLAAYVGKASVGTIGSRIESHLSKSPERTNGTYTMYDRSGHTFIIEAVVAIGVREAWMWYLASALEEFIIARVQERVYLLNGTGVE